MDKLKLLDAVIERLENMLERAEAARRNAQADANSHLGRLQSRYDTFKEEAQYLASAHERRICTLASWLAACRGLRAQWITATPTSQRAEDRVVRLGSLVTLCYYDTPECPSDPLVLFILPASLGEELSALHHGVELVSVDAPLARALLGHRQGEEITIPAPTLSTATSAGTTGSKSFGRKAYIIDVE